MNLYEAMAGHLFLERSGPFHNLLFMRVVLLLESSWNGSGRYIGTSASPSAVPSKSVVLL